MVVAFLVWSMAMSALFMGKAGLFAFVGGSSNIVQQNVQSKSNE
jgi:hypothetical protein